MISDSPAHWKGLFVHANQAFINESLTNLTSYSWRGSFYYTYYSQYPLLNIRFFFFNGSFSEEDLSKKANPGRRSKGGVKKMSALSHPLTGYHNSSNFGFHCFG